MEIVGDGSGPLWELFDDFSDGAFASDKWETGYWDGAQAPEVVDGKARLSSNGSGVGSQVPSFMDDLVGMPDNGTNHSFLTITDNSVVGVEAEISLSSTSSIETGLYLGIMEELESGPGFAFAGIELGYWDQSGPGITFDNSIYENGEETLDEVLQEKPANLGQSYKVSVVKEGSTYQLFLDDQLVQEYPIRGELLFFHFGAFQEPSVSFDTYVDNVRVIRRGDEIEEVVVEDPNGKPVVIKQGDEYRWSDSLDGVILWSVEWEPGESPDALTAKFENGKIIYGFDFVNDVTNAGSNSVDYSINQLGYISSLEGDGEYQYYNAVAVENGAISTIQGDQGLDSVSENGINIVDQWFFTTRAAAEEFYASKTGGPLWELYDDFEDSTLDSSKWLYSTNLFVGNQPTMVNGRIELTGLTSGQTHANTFLIMKNLDGIVGLEGEISLPGDAPVDTGVLIGIADAGEPVGWIDLWADGDNTRIYISLENSATSEFVELNRTAELGAIYRVGIIREEQKTALFLNDEKVAEVSSWDSENLDFLFRGVNDAGSPFTAYLDNARVIRDWEDYDDFSSLIGDDSGSGYAPESIVGSVVNINLNFTDGVEQQTETFFTGRKVFHNGDGDWTYYDYEKISDNQARITYTFEDETDPMPEVVNLTFTSPTQGTFDWAEYTDTSLSTI